MTRKQIKQYLEGYTKIGTDLQKSYYKWILRHGMYFNKTVKPEHMGKMKECYYNSQLANREEGDYYEGWGMRKKLPIPIDHAFNVVGYKVCDRTWADGEEYFGVKIPWDFVVEKLVETKIATNLLSTYYLERVKIKRVGGK